MDNYRGSGDDIAHRSLAQRFNYRFRANYSRSERDSIAGNAYIEMILVLPILVAVFLGLATVTSMFLGKMAVSQAAQNGVQAWAAGDSVLQVDQVVASTLNQEGYHGVPSTTASAQGNAKTVSVTVPYTLWNTGGATHIAVSRTLTILPKVTSQKSPSPIITVGGSSGYGGGGGYVYHHFPMW